MAREKRVIDPNVPYHVFCRGSNRGPIVWDDFDCRQFCTELDWVACQFEWEVLASCLMPNHHHLVLRTDTERFAQGFQQLNGNHSRRTNRRHGRSDHLFRNRPQMVQIDGPAHLVGAIAYVLRNPVEAGLVDHAAEWRWSSYRATAGLEPAPDARGIDLDAEHDAAVHRHGQRLGAAHAAEACGHGQGSGERTAEPA